MTVGVYSCTPFEAGEYPACREVQGSLGKCHAHQKVKDKAGALCASG